MLFDVHMINALGAGFAFYRTRESEFKGLFASVSDSVLSDWFTEFDAHFPAFRTRNARGVDEAPLVVVSPLSERVTQTVLGDFDGRDEQGRGVDAYLVRETVDITIIAKSPDMARVYHVLIRAAIAIARRSLHRVGYHLVEYGGADALAPHEDLAAEEIGLFIRRVTASADTRVSITIPTTAEFDGATYSGDALSVLADDQTDANGNIGGVGVVHSTET